jgi:hypothetical protein
VPRVLGALQQGFRILICAMKDSGHCSEFQKLRTDCPANLLLEHGDIPRQFLLDPQPRYMLRRACGYALARPRHADWLGHRSIAHTTRYTQLSAAPFKDFWR